MSEYLVNGVVFETKEAIQNMCSLFLYNYPDGSTLNPEDTDFIYDVLTMHPNADEKIGVGVKSIGVRLNPTYRRNKEFVVYRTDGSFTEFSYRKCLRPPSHCSRFILACRQAIASGIMAYSKQYFRTTPYPVCPFTGEMLTPDNSHVDHIHPFTFRRLLEDFISRYKVDIDAVQLSTGKDNSSAVLILDKQLEAAWIEYHWKHAKLRVISANANLRLGDREPPLDPAPILEITADMESRRQHWRNELIAQGWVYQGNPSE